MKKLGWIIVLFFVIVLICLCVGRYPISPKDVIALLLNGTGIELSQLPVPEDKMMIFWNIRLPRVLLAILVGAGLSTSGAVFQALFQNPLAAPDILGVTAGASFGAALAIVFLTPVAWMIHGNAFVFGIIAVFLAYLLATGSRDRSPSVLVISGIVISAVFQAGLPIIMYLANPYDQLAQIVFWTMGSFHTASWTKLEVTLPVLIPGIFLVNLFAWRLNILTQNEDDSLSMGLNIFRWRIFFVLISTLMVAGAVASVGRVAWVGLIIPHITRYLVGSENKKLVPATAVLGALFLVIMDSMARSIMLSEIPISIVTSIFGAPFLGYLVISAGKKRFEHDPVC